MDRGSADAGGGGGLLGVCERCFRRHLVRYEADGLAGLVDRRLEQASR